MEQETLVQAEPDQDYHQFLESKITVAEKVGIDIHPGELHPSAKPHQQDTIMWALALGRAGIFLDCSLGKSQIQLEICTILQSYFGGVSLIVTELGVTPEFCDPEIGEGPRLGINIPYVTNTAEAMAEVAKGARVVVTNYERVRNGDIDFSAFTCVCLDEGNYLKNIASDTTAAIGYGLDQVKYKFICTATPSPNRHLEIVNYAHFLGVMDRGQALTRFFKRNSQKAGDLTLKEDWSMLENQEADFWLWVRSWSIWLTDPSDLGHESDDYKLPELEIRWHKLDSHNTLGSLTDKDGQVRVFDADAKSLQEAARVKRQTIDQRVEFVMSEIVAKSPEDHFVLWHHLEDERKAIKKAFSDIPQDMFAPGGYGEIFGSQPWDKREKATVDFSQGRLKILGTKSSLSGVGSNFHRHCHRSVAVGIDHDFDMFYQAVIKRVFRFTQKHKVIVDVVYMDVEEPIRQNIERKYSEHLEMRKVMSRLIRKYGLTHDVQIAERRRSFAAGREEFKGEKYTLVNSDCVLELQRMIAEGIKVQMILSSFPFGNHYEYTALYNDFGHNQTDGHFIRQLDFLIPSLLAVLEPGRIAAIHLKNRIHYGSVTGKGFSTFHRFTHKVCDAMEKHGFECIGFHYVDTDVVRENNQTYRLGHTEMCKDSTKMGAGIPEEIWLFRRPQTNKGKAYADNKVQHDKKYFGKVLQDGEVEDEEEYDDNETSNFVAPDEPEYKGEWVNPDGYSCAQWQIDANAHWRSSGNRDLTPEEITSLTAAQVAAWWKQHNATHIYDYQKHVALCEALEKAKRLPRTFALMPVQPTSGAVWNDINFMNCLNSEQTRRKLQNHICPQPTDEVDRLIDLYSNPDDLILDCFGGIGTTGKEAIKLGRKAYIIELSPLYAKTALMYLQEAEMGAKSVSLFDLFKMEAK